MKEKERKKRVEKSTNKIDYLSGTMIVYNFFKCCYGCVNQGYPDLKSIYVSNNRFRAKNHKYQLRG